MSGTEKPQATTNRDEPRRRLAHVDRPSSAGTEYRSVRFYESETSLVRIVAEFLAEGFRRGSPGIVIATAGQRAAIVTELADLSFDVVALEHSRDLLLLDAEETLSAVMVDGQPNAQAFRDHMRRMVETVSRARTSGTVRVFGQLVDVLWQRGQRDAAIRLELLWNQLAQAAGASLVCGYVIGNFYKAARAEAVCDLPSPCAAADRPAKQGSPASGTRRGGLKCERR